MSVNQRVNFLVQEVSNSSQTAFANLIGIKPGSVSDIVGGRLNKPSFDVLNKIAIAIPKVNVVWLLTGEGEMFKSEISANNSVNEEIFPYLKKGEKKHELQAIPLYDITAAAGLNALHNSANNIIDYLSIPNLAKCDGAVYLKGDSMYPLLKHGDIVAYQQIPVSVEEIYFGEMYIVDMSTPHREKIVVKYVQKSELGEDYITLVSYNEKHHPPKDIHIKKVRALAEVKASIRLT